MSVIFGYSGGGSRIEDLGQALLHWEPDRKDHYQDQFFSIGVLEQFNVPESLNCTNPFNYKDFVVVADCRIDNRDELSSLLSIDKPFSFSDTAFIAFAFEKWKDDTPKYLVGDFAFMVYNKNDQSIFAARDHFGIRPFYYAVLGEKLIFSSEQKGILAHKGFVPQINDRQIISLFSHLKMDSSETVYQNIHSLKPGHCLKFRNGKIEVEQYWNIYQVKVDVPDTKEEQEKEFNRLVRQSIKDRLRSYRKVGAELSGGLDSSGIVGLAMEQLGKGKEFHTYSYVKPDNGTGHFDQKDDSHIVREICQKHGIEKWLKIVNEKDISGEELIKLMLTVFDEYSENGVPLLTSSFLKYAEKDGVGTILSGWGGDQVVTTKVSGFSSGLAYNRKYLSLWRDLRRRNTFGRTVLGFWYNVIKYAKTSKIDVKQLKDHHEVLDRGLIKKSKEKHFNLRAVPNIFNYRLYANTVKDRLIQDLTHFSVYKRALDHVHMGTHYKVDYRFPLMDVRLVSCMVNLPLETISPKKSYRYLYSKLVQKFVPDSVVNNAKSRVPTAPFYNRLFRENVKYLNHELNEIKYSKFLNEYFNMIESDELISYIDEPRRLEQYLKLIFLGKKVK